MRPVSRRDVEARHLSAVDVKRVRCRCSSWRPPGRHFDVRRADIGVEPRVGPADQQLCGATDVQAAGGSDSAHSEVLTPVRGAVVTVSGASLEERISASPSTTALWPQKCEFVLETQYARIGFVFFRTHHPAILPSARAWQPWEVLHQPSSTGGDLVTGMPCLGASGSAGSIFGADGDHFARTRGQPCLLGGSEASFDGEENASGFLLNMFGLTSRTRSGRCSVHSAVSRTDHRDPLQPRGAGGLLTLGER